MRILFTRFPLESTLGGAEIQTLSLMEGLIERGHAVAFAGSCPVLLAECRKRNIPVAEVQIGPPPVTKWAAISFAWRKQGIKQKLRGLLNSFGKLDVIVMLSLSEKLLLTDVAHDAGKKVIWIEHDRVGRWLTHNPWLPLLLRQSTKTVTLTVSELSKKLYEGMGWSKKNIVAIPNGVELRGRTASSYEKSPKLAARSSQLRLGCIARLSHEKGVDVLIEAMADTSDSTTLEIIGTGREEKTLKALTHRLHLDDRVTCTPHETDIGSAFARWDALILPSRDNDPFGMVAAEAMLAGLPVIVTDQCGIADYLEDGKDALIVKANSVSALTHAIKRVGERSQEIGENGRKTAEKKFTVERMVEEYEKVMT